MLAGLIFESLESCPNNFFLIYATIEILFFLQHRQTSFFKLQLDSSHPLWLLFLLKMFCLKNWNCSFSIVARTRILPYLDFHPINLVPRAFSQFKNLNMFAGQQVNFSRAYCELWACICEKSFRPQISMKYFYCN